MGNPKLKVLLVEDDQTMVSLLDTLLTLEGFSVMAPRKHHIDSLIELMHQEQPEIALVDVNLRSFNGLDLVREIRQDPEIKDMVILMCSGLNIKPQAIQSGADGFLLKPFMPDELIKSIHTNIQKKDKISITEKG